VGKVNEYLEHSSVIHNDQRRISLLPLKYTGLQFAHHFKDSEGEVEGGKRVDTEFLCGKM
jgi:hypothetical protein